VCVCEFVCVCSVLDVTVYLMFLVSYLFVNKVWLLCVYMFGFCVVCCLFRVCVCGV